MWLLYTIVIDFSLPPWTDSTLVTSWHDIRWPSVVVRTRSNVLWQQHQDIHGMAYRSVAAPFGIVWSSIEHVTASNSHIIRIISIRTSGLDVSDFISGHIMPNHSIAQSFTTTGKAQRYYIGQSCA